MDGVETVDPAREVVGKPALMNVPIDCVEAGLQLALDTLRREHNDSHPDEPPAEFGWEEDAMVWRRPDSRPITFRLRAVDEDTTELVCGGEMMVPFESVSAEATQMMEGMMTSKASGMAGQITSDYNGYAL